MKIKISNYGHFTITIFLIKTEEVISCNNLNIFRNHTQTIKLLFY